MEVIYIYIYIRNHVLSIKRSLGVPPVRGRRYASPLTEETNTRINTGSSSQLIKTELRARTLKYLEVL
jgi:hypothetical protein